jgi:hypothetical protein
VNVNPSNADVQETIATLNFASRARNAEISLGNRDTIKKWRDMVIFIPDEPLSGIILVYAPCAVLCW